MFLAILTSYLRALNNRSRVPADAKARCAAMAKDYPPPRARTVHPPGAVLMASGRMVAKPIQSLSRGIGGIDKTVASVEGLGTDWLQ